MAETKRHHISAADEVYAGDVFYSKYSPDGRRGVKLSHMFAVELGAVDVKDADGICVDTSATGAVSLTPTGALVSGGVATMDVPRGVSITSTADESGVDLTFTGTDEYGETLVETITGPTNGATVYGKKAFKTVTAISTDGALTSTKVDIGSSDVLGLPLRIADKGDVCGVFVDGVPETTLTVVAGLTTTQVATATNGDTRGTVTPNTAPDGTAAFTVLLSLGNRKTKDAAFGVDVYGG